MSILVSTGRWSSGTAVHDVQFTMIADDRLVVAGELIFLRILWATVIPSLPVPSRYSDLCRFMYVVGYSLATYSLMALTIRSACVDDAIHHDQRHRAGVLTGRSPV